MKKIIITQLKEFIKLNNFFEQIFHFHTVIFISSDKILINCQIQFIKNISIMYHDFRMQYKISIIYLE